MASPPTASGFRPARLPVALLAWLLISGPVAGAALERLRALPAGDDLVILDVRPATACAAASLSGARCLPAGDLLGPHRRLASFGGILWLLGTAGLDGSERVVVAGDVATDRAFVAGLLYLAGQRRVVLLETDPFAAGEGGPPGRPRGMVRARVWQAPVRADRVLLRRELAESLRRDEAPVLLDGRSEAEYWGRRIRAARGGHLPGAQHLPSAALAFADAAPFDAAAFGGSPVAYAHDAYEGLVYLARLLAAGVDARLYLEGWVGWAADGALPADAQTFPPLPARRPAPAAGDAVDADARWWSVAALPLLLLAGFIAGRRWGR